MDNINYNNYRYFYEVVKHNGFSNASQKILISQPALSYSIKKLEEDLGVKLLQRNNKSLSLTKEGEELFNKLKKIENILNEDKKEITGKISIGVLRIMADNLLLPILTEFKEKYPLIELEVIIEENRTLLSLFEKHKLNLVINKNVFENANENITNIFLNKFETCFACSKQFYERNKEELSNINNFSSWNLILPPQSKKRREIDGYLENLNLKPKVSLELGNSILLKDMVKNGDYVGYFTKLAIEKELNSNELIKLKCFKNLPCENLYLIYDENNIDTQIKQLIKIIREKI